MTNTPHCDRFPRSVTARMIDLPAIDGPGPGDPGFMASVDGWINRIDGMRTEGFAFEFSRNHDVDDRRAYDWLMGVLEAEGVVERFVSPRSGNHLFTIRNDSPAAAYGFASAAHAAIEAVTRGPEVHDDDEVSP